MTATLGTSHLVRLAIAILLAASLPASAQDAAGRFEVDVETRPITRFHIPSGTTRFGRLEYVGGFTMRSGDRRFGQLSSFRFLDPGGNFIGVADHGYWFFGSIERDRDGVPTGVAGFTMEPILTDQASRDGEKHHLDAEGLEIDGDIATVTFEREHRASEYRISPNGMGRPLRDIDYVIPRHELRYNQGMETIAQAPEAGALSGARIIIAERSIDTDGNIFAAIVEGPQKGIFKVLRSDDFDVTDGVFLPDGDLLLLERRFRPPAGISMRLRLVEGETVRPGALVDGETIMEAGFTHQIDNMEAIDVWQRADGATIISLMSDHNQSFLQRNLYHEFVLHPR
jgi:hypothetical protein